MLAYAEKKKGKEEYAEKGNRRRIGYIRLLFLYAPKKAPFVGPFFVCTFFILSEACFLSGECFLR